MAEKLRTLSLTPNRNFLIQDKECISFQGKGLFFGGSVHVNFGHCTETRKKRCFLKTAAA